MQQIFKVGIETYFEQEAQPLLEYLTIVAPHADKAVAEAKKRTKAEYLGDMSKDADLPALSDVRLHSIVPGDVVTFIVK